MARSRSRERCGRTWTAANASRREPEARTPRVARVLTAPLAVLLPLVLFLDRAVMVDDTLFLKAADHIRRAPLRPYDFVVNWYGWPESFATVFKNPPGVAYWLALAESTLGTSERALHAAMLPFAVLAVVAGGALARRFAGDAPWVTALWVASPAFLVSAATLMADVPALAFMLSGLALWIHGVDRNIGRARLAGALVAGLAVVIKYTAVLTLPLLAFYAVLFVDRARLRRRLVDVWPGIVPLGVWSAVTLVASGRIHVLQSLTLGGGGLHPNPGWFVHRAIALLTFTVGAGVFPLLLVWPPLRRKQVRWLLLAGCVAVAAGLATPMVWSPRGVGAGAAAAVAVLAGVGACAAATAADSVRASGTRERDRDAEFLVGWLALVVLSLWFWSWSIAARFVLPALVPLALLLGRAFGARPGRRPSKGAERVVAVATAATLAVAVVVLAADGDAGEVPRLVVPAIAARARAEGLAACFVGSWGFQHYAEQAGLTRLDTRAPDVRPGELILQPYYASNREMPPALEPRLRLIASIPGPRPVLSIHTMNINVGAGFHSSAYGPLPFVRAPMPAEGVLVWQVVE